jgi:hypothetical protein
MDSLDDDHVAPTQLFDSEVHNSYFMNGDVMFEGRSSYEAKPNLPIKEIVIFVIFCLLNLVAR